MQKNPEREKKFGTWQAIANFSVNNDTWTAPCDGFLLLRLSGASVTDPYIYAYSGTIQVATVSIKGATGGYTYTNTTPVYKGQTFTLYTNQTSSVYTYFMPIEQ